MDVLGPIPEEMVNSNPGFKQQYDRIIASWKDEAFWGLKHTIPNASEDALDLLEKMLKYDAVSSWPQKDRISVDDALRHPYL